MSKKLLALFLAIVMGLSLAACGGSDQNEEKEEKKEKTEEETVEEEPEEEGLADSYWICTGFVMGGELMDEETMEMFEITEEDLNNMLMVHFNEDQTLTWMMYQDYDEEGNEINGMIGETVPYEESEEGITTSLMDIEAFFEFQDENLYYGDEEDGFEAGFVLSRVDERPAAFDENPDITFHISFSEEETVAMSAFMNYGEFLMEGETLYGRFYGEDSKMAVFAKMSWKVKDDSEYLDKETPVLLDDECSPEYIIREGDWLYYRRYDYNDQTYSLCRIHDDGTDKEVLYEEFFNYMQIHNGRIWLSNTDYQFCSMALDGTDMKVEYEEELYYPYFVDDDWIVCQVDADNETLHLINLSTGQDRKLTDRPTYSPILAGSDLYFQYRNDGEEDMHLGKVSLTTFEVEYAENIVNIAFACDGANIHIASEEGYSYEYPLEEYQSLKNAIEENANYESVPYVSGDYSVEYSWIENRTKLIVTLFYRITGESLPRVPGV